MTSMPVPTLLARTATGLLAGVAASVLLAAGPVPASGGKLPAGAHLARGPIGLADVEGGYASAHVLVRLRPGAKPAAVGGAWTFTAPGAPRGSALARDAASSGALLAQARVSAIEPVFPALAKPVRAAAFSLDRTYRVELPAGSDTPTLVTRLAALGAVVEFAELDGVGGLAAIPNDPEFPLQYDMHNTGQIAGGIVGVPDADIDAPEAWDIAPDTSGIVIGLLDAGVNPHLELTGRILPGFNVPDNNTVTLDECSSHGTHVSGIMAAARDNGLGIAGVASQAKIKPWVVVNGCSGLESSVATALQQATDAGLRVLNLSLQYYSGTQTLHDAVLYAADADVVMVCAAGNNGNSNVAYPGKWPETICVAALNPDDTAWSGSNFGPEVDIAAAGNNVHSLIGTAAYGDKTGTSMATPHVTGIVALILAKNPTLTPTQVRDILQATAVDVGTPGYDTHTGYGRANAYAALLATPVPVTPDLDHDGTVGAADLALLLGAWGPCVDCESGCAADLDGDCSVGASDLAILLGAWG